MKIKDILERDPASHPLVNNGQARILDDRSAQAQAELRGELSTFVCEGQYAEGMQKILRSFLDCASKTSQRGAWVSGFFGSGKSHLLKVLAHLWQDTQFADGATARSLVHSIPNEIRELLRELDTAGKRSGGLLAAAGTMLGGTTDNVRLTILGILLRASGLPPQYPQARFCLWLHAQDHFEKVKSAIESSGKEFDRELNNLYVSGPIARAVMACDPEFAKTEAEAKQLLKAQFAPQPTDITTDEFLRTAKDALRRSGKKGRMPCTLLILDELQQYIGGSNERSVLVTEVAESVSKQLDSQVIVVGAGQSALTSVPLLQKLMDRFTIRVPLSDADVETVTRKVLLRKKPSAVAGVRALLDKHAGEISRELQGTAIGERMEDSAVIVDDYPLLPARRRFWENCFRQIDAAGTASALRSQLQIVHRAVSKLSERELGAVIPADELYDQLAPAMLNTGVLLREINERIIQIGRDMGPLAQRICGLVFLIGKLKRDEGADIGVRATKDHLCDLLIDDLAGDNARLRGEIESALAKLAAQGTLLRVEDEYRLQTREGSEWDREFRNRQSKLNGDDAAIQFRRDQLLYGEIDKVIRGVRVVQGSAKEPRQFIVTREQTPPNVDGSGVPIWIRDAWSCPEKEVVNSARAAGTDSPTIFVSIPLKSADDLRRLIVDSEAAQRTLDARGNPTTDEGQEARQAMESRCARTIADRDRLAREVIEGAKVYQGGGSEMLTPELDERIRAAAEASLIRLFPRFKEADSGYWEAVLKRAKDGADHPFQPVGHTDATENHPVCRQALATIGAGKTGTETRKALQGAPFGWPRDAIDAVLIALHRAQHVSATLNGQSVAAGQLDQNRIAKAEFRVEKTTLSVTDRIVLRQLFQLAGISVTPGDEALRAGEFIRKLAALAQSAGGDAPLSPRPSTTEIEDTERLAGNDQLAAIRRKADEWKDRIKSWSATRDLIAQRLPTWALVERLARHATSIAGAEPYLAETGAIRNQRLLLDSSDPANAIRVALAGSLRKAVAEACATHASAFDAAAQTLAGNAVWTKLPSAERDNIKATVGLRGLATPEISGDGTLADYLDRYPLANIQTETDAIPGRVAQAIERAARSLEPKVQMVALECCTLRDLDEVEAWIKRQKIRLVEAVRLGPVLVG